MSDENTKKALITLPQSLDQGVSNLINEPTKNMGTTFGDLWFLVFGKVSQAASRRRIQYEADLEAFRTEIESKKAKIPKEKLVEPSLQVAGQALENSKYCVSNQELRNMFSSLIANSMNYDFANDIHPSFPEIIKQMSTLDAIVLAQFKGITGFTLIADYIVEDKRDSGFQVAQKNIYLPLPEIHFELKARAISSLVRLGLLEIPPGESAANDSLYTPFYETEEFRQLSSKTKRQFADKEAKISKRLIRLTPLGGAFNKVCLSD